MVRFGRGESLSLRLLSFGAFWIFSGCSTFSGPEVTEVDFQDQAASFNMAITMVAPWEDYAKSLSPGFKLTGDQALKKAIPATSILQEINVEQSSVSAKFSMPLVASSVQETVTGSVTTAGDSSESTSSTESVTSLSESLAGASVPSVTVPQTIPSSKAPEGLSSLEPLGTYSAATALYQEVQLLNRYVADVALRSGFTPYVVRLQLGVVPYQRTLPYDIYTTFSFFPKWECVPAPAKACPSSIPEYENPGLVVPLLVTDSLESSLATRTGQLTQQLGVALGFLAGKVIGDVGAGTIRDQIASFTGSDLNSTFTVGRISDGVVQLRLGAVRHSANSHIMVPRNHHITMLVMVPNEVIVPSDSKYDGVNGVTSVAVRAFTQLRHSKTGEELSQRTRSDEYDILAKRVIASYVDPSNSLLLPTLVVNSSEERACRALGQPKGYQIEILSKNSDERACIRGLVQRLQDDVVRNKFKSFRKFASEIGIDSHRRELWLRFSEELGRREYVGANFELPKREVFGFPAVTNSFPVVNDTKVLRALLINGKGLSAEHLNAQIQIRTTSGGASRIYDIPAKQISVSKNQQDLALVFPSPDSMGLKNFSIGDLKLTYVAGRYEARNTISCPTGVCTQTYSSGVLTATKTPKPTPQYTVRSPVVSIAADKSGNGEVSVFLEAKKIGGTLPVDSIILEVHRASIVSVSAKDSKGSAIANPVAGLGRIVAIPNTEVFVQLGNLVNGHEVEVKAQGMKGGSKIMPKPPNLKFEVKGP